MSNPEIEEVDPQAKCPQCGFTGSIMWEFDCGGAEDGECICNKCFCFFDTDANTVVLPSEPPQ